MRMDEIENEFYQNIPLILSLLLKLKEMEEKELYKTLSPKVNLSENRLRAWIKSLKESPIPKFSEEEVDKLKHKMTAYSMKERPICETEGRYCVLKHMMELCKIAELDSKQSEYITSKAIEFLYLIGSGIENNKYPMHT